MFKSWKRVGRLFKYDTEGEQLAHSFLHSAFLGLGVYVICGIS